MNTIKRFIQVLLFLVTVNSQNVTLNKPISINPITRFNTRENLFCLTDVIYHEAGNQRETGKIAIGLVVFNRIKQRQYTLSPCQILAQPGQFRHYRVISNANKRTKEYYQGLRIAKNMLADPDGFPDITKNATHYHADFIKPPYWVKAVKETIRIQNHIFYANQK